ncbi:MAG: NAD(P)/FAD-dependent oxidoreductase [Balneolaceae bacterium]
MEIAVIGGGAAGFFAALSCKAHHPKAKVHLYEKSSKLLAKVKVSGGGRCNVTHSCFKVSELVKNYPRGGRALKKSLGIFNTNHTIDWFKERGVELKTEADGRMFPTTDDSQTIIDCLTKEARHLGVHIQANSPVKYIQKREEGFLLGFKRSETKKVDKVIVATGGSPRLTGFDWLKKLGHTVEEPVPSLFTFNMPNEPVKELMGVVVNPVEVRIQGTKLKSEGPLLITHWGMSGPAILKLSAFGARILHEKEYNFVVMINWAGNKSEEEIRSALRKAVKDHPKKKVNNVNSFSMPTRMWEFLLKKLDLPEDMIWENLGKKNINRLTHILFNDEYRVKGKTTFKEEFVTCGGIKLPEVNMKTMQSRIIPGFYFAGEVLDIDGVTGGFNFQSAWTTGFIAGRLESAS